MIAASRSVIHCTSQNTDKGNRNTPASVEGISEGISKSCQIRAMRTTERCKRTFGISAAPLFLPLRSRFECPLPHGVRAHFLGFGGFVPVVLPVVSSGKMTLGTRLPGERAPRCMR